VGSLNRRVLIPFSDRHLFPYFVCYHAAKCQVISHLQVNERAAIHCTAPVISQHPHPFARKSNSSSFKFIPPYVLVADADSGIDAPSPPLCVRPLCAFYASNKPERLVQVKLAVGDPCVSSAVVRQSLDRMPRTFCHTRSSSYPRFCCSFLLHC
jgi:hypothetical protein